MHGHGMRTERETIINFNEEDATAGIWTASETIYRRLIKRLGMECLTEDGERHAVFTVQKKQIRLPSRPRATRVQGRSAKQLAHDESLGRNGKKGLN